MLTCLQYKLLITNIFLGLGAGLVALGVLSARNLLWSGASGVVEKSSADQEILNAAIQASNNVSLCAIYFFNIKKICVELMVQETLPAHILNIIWERIAVS